MPEFGIFYGSEKQCERVKRVIENARRRKVNEFVIEAEVLEIAPFQDEDYVLNVAGPRCDIHTAHYLAVFGDGVHESDEIPPAGIFQRSE